MGILLLCCYHLVVPLEMGGHSDRLTAAFVALIALSGGGSLFVLARRRFSVNLAEVAMALASVGSCAIAVMAVPSAPALMVHRFPMIFNAMVVGLAVAAWVWTCLALSWRRQLEVGSSDDKAMKKRMVHCAERFSFTTACMGLLIAFLMAIWPRLPRIAAMDDSFGRFTAGISGNLFLLWVTLWCGRRLSRVTFHLLAILVLISTAGFVAVRVAPFTSAG